MDDVIYLDHAATSAPKPERVAARIARYLQMEGLSAGRGSYRRAVTIGQEIEGGRKKLASLIHAESADRVVFTTSGTEALNLALGCLGQEPGHVIVTSWEHNSVLRPLAAAADRGVTITEVEPGADGRTDPGDVRAAITSETKLICCVHASNVTGVIQPVGEICQLAKERGILSLIDAAQTVGHLPIDVQEMGCSLLAAPCHKGLLAPLGTGFLYLQPGLEDRIPPLQFGGTGTQSEQAVQPAELPYRYESGSRNVPGLIGLAASLEAMSPESIADDAAHQRELTAFCLDRLKGIPGVTVSLPDLPGELRVGVLSLNVEGQDPRVVGTILDEYFQIEVRTGFHCAPQAHQWLGTAELGGTVRISFGSTTSESEIEKLADALQQIAGSF
ncbi:aminotransferase class V-fold PLP-dependent enzyme [Rubinisphaera margarita]|uniref:aminotransferase class V-fold PLP-dependent enzyme n=1 Tax=Rubinisphaera margarita TaxID=2909586 RepID=UPI001EE7FBC7|nr:aminotransferase class V-fold PLP-dependent enzyme [Rubinisphaera margarita]MCG6155048.1 aminotransferase class V-fold PLP-dependent enzyme [Rubinisphaera margarita]